MIKMGRLKTFQKSLDRPPQRHPQTFAGAIDFLLTDRSRNHGHSP
jgi:hypothetical protein